MFFLKKPGSFLFVIFCFSLAIVSSGQQLIVPDRFVFYSGDTLSDFDFKTLLDRADVKTFAPQELLEFLHHEEAAFVRKKYSLPVQRPVMLMSRKFPVFPLASSCNNADFEDGDYTSWTGNVGCNENSLNPLTITSPGVNTLGTNSGVPTCSWHTLVTTGTDPYGGFPMLDPGGGSYACRLGGSNVNLSNADGGCGNAGIDPIGAFGETLEQTFLVTPANSMFTFNYAVVLNDGGHPNTQEPYFSANVYDASNNLITCLSFSQECTAGTPPPGFSTSALTGPLSGAVYYLPWSTHVFNLKPFIGTNITIVFTASGCAIGGHFGYAYVDCTCGQVWPQVAPACNSDTVKAPIGGITYAWTGPGVVSGGASQNAVVNVSGVYSVLVTTSTTPLCTYTLDTTVVVPPPLSVAVTPVNPVCFGGTGSASSLVSGGTTPFTYLWSTGLAGTGATGLTAANYSLKITDSLGCTDQQAFVVTQPSAVQLSATSIVPSCFGSCNGQAGVIPSGGVGGLKIKWNTGSTSAGITGLCAGNVSVTVTDNNGCFSDTAFVVTQPVAISETMSSTPTFCSQRLGSATVVSVAGGTGPYEYSWNNSALTISISNLTGGYWTVTVTDAHGCTSEDSVLVIDHKGVSAAVTAPTAILCFGNCSASATAVPIGGTGPFQYAWSGGAGAATVASNLCAGIYSVTITDANNCTSSANVSVNQPTPIVLPVLAPDTMCIGQTKILTALPSGGTPGYTITWNPGNLVSPTYEDSLKTTATFTVDATDANGCPAAQQTVRVTVDPPLGLLAGNPAPVCPGAAVQLSSQGSGGDGIYSYTWLTNPVQNTSTLKIPSVNTSQTYTVIVNDNCSTPADTAKVLVTVNPLPAVNFVADVYSGCPILCVQFTDKSTITSGSLASWSWGFGNDSLANSTIENGKTCYKTGLYSVWLTVTSDKGCSTTDTIDHMITVYPDPVAAFTYNPSSETVVNPFYAFTDLSTTASGTISSWRWNFGDSANPLPSFVQDPSHMYPGQGTYCVKLGVVNSYGCLDSTMQCLTVGPAFAFYVPNAFTPNGDGINDYFFGDGIGIKHYKMLIFDRWGNQIFTATSQTTRWDGTANGGSKVAQQDVYVYEFLIEDVFNVQHSYVGHVTLVR